MPKRQSTAPVVQTLRLLVAVLASPTLVMAQNAAAISWNGANPCGTNASGRITLSGAAPSGGRVVQLSSNLPSSASVPATVTVSAGALFAEFGLTCTPSTQAIAVTISATVSGTTTVVTSVVNVLAPVLNTISVEPHTGGQSVNGQVTLVAAAPAGGVVVTLSVTNSLKATVPVFVTVTAGASSASFTVTTRSVVEPTTVAILATALGVSKTVDLTIRPPRTTAIGFNIHRVPVWNPALVLEGGTSVQARVTIGAPAAGGFTVQLTSSRPDIVAVPATLSFSSGDLLADLSVTTVTVKEKMAVTITATSGGASQAGVLTVLPPILFAVGLTPQTVIGGQSARAQLFYIFPAPPGGTLVHLFTSNTQLAHVPETVTVPAGATTATFNVSTNGVETPATVTISANSHDTTRVASLTLAPEGPTVLNVAPSRVVGGANVRGTLDALNSQDDFTVRLTSSDPAMASVPATVAFTAGSTRQTFTIATTPVAQDAHVTITATTTWAQKSEFLAAEPTRHTLTVTRTSSLAILAPTVATFSFNSSSVVGGTYAGGQVTISGPAPAGGIGFGVALEGVGGGTLYYTGATIPAGATSATFSLPTPRVTNPTNVTVAITLGNRQTTSSLGLKPGP